SMKSLSFLATILIAAAPPPTGPDPAAAYAAETEAWRATRETRLRAPDGWLALVGLTWLKPGPNRFGGAPDDDVVLPAAVPAHAGSLVLEGRVVRLVVPAGSPVKIDGRAATSRVLRTDAAPPADVLTVGSVTWEVIERGERIGVRVRD